MGNTVAAQKIDVYRRFRPTGSQAKFLRSQARGRLFSSGYGSGKSMVGCREAIRWAVQYPGSRGLIGRQVADELKTSTMVTFWKQMDVIGFKRDVHYVHNRSEREITFWNGSVIIYRHLDDPGALGSVELNWAFIDEGAEVSDDIYKTISSSRLRWHLPDCTHQEEVERLIEAGASDEEIMAVKCPCPRGIWVCTNPGGSDYLEAVTNGLVSDWEWIKAKPGDNPYNGPEYYEKMERDRQINGDLWMRMYYDGEWGVFEGQRFTMFDRSKHVLDVGWRPNDSHRVAIGWDFGHVETFVSFIAYHPTLNEPITVFDEVVVNEVKDPADVATLVKEKIARYELRDNQIIHMGDPAGTGASQFSAISPIGAYAAFGLHINPARKGKSPTDRANVLSAFLNESRVQMDGSKWPGIVFTAGTPRTVHSVINLRWRLGKGRAGEDPREVFVDKDKHGFDALTYGLYAVPPPDLPVAPKGPRSGVNVGALEAFRRG